MNVFSPEQLKKLEKALSTPRLQRYITLAGGDLNAALALHNWNSKLGSALHLPLQLFELVFRNHLNDAMASKFGDKWYDAKSGTFDDEAKGVINAAKDKLFNQGRPEIPPSVICQFSFGFWVNLLKTRYETPLWIPSLKNAFIYAPKPVMRDTSFKAVDRIRGLRNRIAHHEPIYHRDLEKELSHVKTVAGWFCQETAGWIDQCGDELRTVLSAKPGPKLVSGNKSELLTTYADRYELIDWKK